MTDPIRAALERLIARIEETHNPDDPVPAWFDSYFAARAALAETLPPKVGHIQRLADIIEECQPKTPYVIAATALAQAILSHPDIGLVLGNSDGPAVPESREPASVAGKSSDENCWQWYTYCPEEGLEMYSDRKQAQSAAQSIMGSYEVAAHSDGWHEDMELVSWGMLVPVEQAQVVERKTAEPDDEFDEWVKYELRPVRWGHQPAPLVAGAPGPSMEDVGPLIAWLTEQACQAADASQPADAGMLTWAAQVIGERVNEDAPVAGEVAELVAWIHQQAIHGPDAAEWRRAAELLQQQHSAPVPVAERLPGPGDRNTEGKCWWFCTAYPGDWPHWILGNEAFCDPTHWLPAHALPLPAVEVEG